MTNDELLESHMDQLARDQQNYRDDMRAMRAMQARMARGKYGLQNARERCGSARMNAWRR